MDVTDATPLTTTAVGARPRCRIICIRARAVKPHHTATLYRYTSGSLRNRHPRHTGGSLHCAVSAAEQHGQMLRSQQQQPVALLRSFKTDRCTNPEYHNRGLCRYYHGDHDRRRDPYASPYSVQDATNNLERSYHPQLYRTAMCFKRHSCDFAKEGLCAFAHSPAELRREEALEYQLPEAVRERPLRFDLAQACTQRGAFGGFGAPAAPPVRVCWGSPAGAGGSSKIASRTILLTPFQTRVIDCSRDAWAMIELAAAERLCRAERVRKIDGHEIQLRITGSAAEEIASILPSLIDPFPETIVVCSRKSYPTRILQAVEQRLVSDGQGAFLSKDVGSGSGSSSPPALLQVTVNITDEDPDETGGTVCVMELRRTGACVGRQILDKIDFWIEQEGLDKFLECICCLSDVNADQGVACGNGHFICTRGDGDGCFAGMVDSQLPSIASQDGKLLCEICKDSFAMSAVAKCVCADTWTKLQDAQVEAKVSQRCMQLQHEFDERLQRKGTRGMPRPLPAVAITNL